VLFDRNPITVIDLMKAVHFHFTLSSRVPRLTIQSKELTNPQELITLDPSHSVEVHPGEPASQNIHMVFGVTKDEQLFGLSLTCDG
jgi:hypothetical protein